jgi:hypothetical protein
MSAKPTPSAATTIAIAICLLPALMGAQEEAPAHLVLAASVPTPWAVLVRPTAFVVVADNGTQVAWVYVQDPLKGDLTHDEARRIASGIARLPELV